ncbi:hypothetical protein PoHVEF18_008304 [Penicillium ochrochloron]
MLQNQSQPALVTTNPIPDPAIAIENLRQANPDISFIRLQWVDYGGVLRAKILVIEQCLSLLASGKSLHAPPIALSCAVDGSVLPSTIPIGVCWLIPDWSSLKPSVIANTITVMCGVAETTPSCLTSNGDLCPRQALVKVVRQADRDWQLNFLVGFEVEFQVMKLSDCKEEGMVPYSRGLGHFAVAGLLDPCWGYVEECVLKLRKLGVHVDGLHPEGQRGQYEITLGPLHPLQAVDQLVLVHSVLKHTFNAHGCMVTMSPKPVAMSPDQMNGQHMHISMQPARPDQEEQFLSGILKRLPTLWPFLLPQEVSYERVAPFCAGDFVGWGTENRLVPIRKIKNSHWEVRSADATANMYLALAAVLSAGLLGIAEKAPLEWPDLSIGAWPNMTLDEIRAQADPLPRSLEESLSGLESNFAGLDSLLGERILQHYLDLKRYERSRVGEMGSEKARNLLIELF